MTRNNQRPPSGDFCVTTVKIQMSKFYATGKRTGGTFRMTSSQIAAKIPMEFCTCTWHTTNKPVMCEEALNRTLTLLIHWQPLLWHMIMFGRRCGALAFYSSSASSPTPLMRLPTPHDTTTPCSVDRKPANTVLFTLPRYVHKFFSIFYSSNLENLMCPSLALPGFSACPVHHPLVSFFVVVCKFQWSLSRWRRKAREWSSRCTSLTRLWKGVPPSRRFRLRVLGWKNATLLVSATSTFFVNSTEIEKC